MYLLKEGAKPVADNRKRRKIPVMALPGQQAAEVQPPKAFGGDVYMQPSGFKEVTPVPKS